MGGPGHERFISEARHEITAPGPKESREHQTKTPRGALDIKPTRKCTATRPTNQNPEAWSDVPGGEVDPTSILQGFKMRGQPPKLERKKIQAQERSPGS